MHGQLAQPNAESEYLGIGDGAGVGIWVGCVVGVGVGRCEGSTVGLNVGTSVGGIVGFAVGKEVMCAVGDAVGMLDGLCVGASEGRSVSQEEAPCFVLYLPGGHWTHQKAADAPIAGPYLPHSHALTENAF
jgi:hypothetical protein